MKNVFNLFPKKIKTTEDGDFERFSNKPGVIIFPISMSKIETDQSPEKIFNFIKTKVLEKFWQGEPISIVIIYSQYFYKKYNQGKSNHLNLIKEHELKLKKLIKSVSFLYNEAYFFYNWDTFINKFGNYKQIENYRDRLYNLAETDEKFSNYIKEDIARLNQTDSTDSRLFLLEETVLFHFLQKEKIKYEDTFTKNKNKWVLIAYSGFALKIMAYVSKENFFKLDGESKNEYQDCFYDFRSGYLYQYKKLDLDKYKSLESYASIAKEVLHKKVA